MNLLLYGLVALAVLGAVGGFVAYERKAGADSVRAELQPKLTACEGQITTLAQETAKKQAQSAQALKKAEGRAKVWESDAARLRNALTNRKPQETDCKAAWEIIRGPK